MDVFKTPVPFGECPHPDCDVEKDSTQKISKHYHMAHGESYVDALAAVESGDLPEEYYAKKYYDEGKTLKEIAFELGVSRHSVARRMDEYRLPRRVDGHPPGDDDYEQMRGVVERLREQREQDDSSKA